MPNGYKGLYLGLNQLVTTMWGRDLAHLDLVFDEMIVCFGSTLKTLNFTPFKSYFVYCLE